MKRTTCSCRSLVFLLMVLLLGIGTKTVSAAEPTKPTPEQTEHFEKKIRPLLIEHCGKCHMDGKTKGGLSMNHRGELLKGGDSGPSLIPGDAAKSLLMQVIRYDGDMKMPPRGKLRDDEIATLEAWVKSGAYWPGAANTKVETQPGILFTADQKAFWAFQPIAKPTVPDAPALKNLHPIDAFVRSAQLGQGLTAAGPADRRTLLRRVTFNLTGLPPTPKELDDFLVDQTPQAFEKVVDRLLASPAYGERWGRHWLDVARYAESNGLDENTAFSNAWKYRDYVVRSFNADKPYNEFLLEQIAGDLLPATSDPKVREERLTALGYLALGAKVLAEPDKQKMMLDIADEQLDTLGKGVMGLTLGCARCHDHKFDPIPTRDYYSLLGIFTSTRTMQNLNTVAKTFEYQLSPPETADVANKRTRIDTIRKDLRKLESEFGKTPVTDKAKRNEIHVKAEAIRAEIKKLEAELPVKVSILGVEEGSAAAYGTQPRNLYVQARGNYISPTEEAPAVFLRIIDGENAKPYFETKPNPADKKEENKTRFGQIRPASGRLELARWLTDPKHPLTARVIVNRVWQHHFGEGIVRSPDNFGKLGERPTHPELLDWLAREFIAQGWSFKKLHRMILLTQTYQQASGTVPPNDPENRFLSVFPKRRLEAEAIRDSMLALAGNLDRTVGGSLFPHGNFEYVGNVNYDSTRRTLYLPVIRGKTLDFLLTFDFPDPVTMNGKRVNTTIAPQALYLMNNPFVQQQARVWAERMLKEQKSLTDRLKLAYQEAYLREPSGEEVQRITAYLTRADAILAPSVKDAPVRELRVWSSLFQTLLCQTEFVMVE